MDRELAAWIGKISGIIIALAYIPQQLQIYTNKSSKDVSIIMYLVVLLSAVGYEIYAFAVNEPVILFTNTLALIQCLIMIFLIWRYKNGSNRHA